MNTSANERSPHAAVDTIPLDGPGWTLHRPQTSESWPATVPGCVHLDLGRAEVLPTLDWRDNEATQQWIDGENWIYRRTFDLSAEALLANRVELVCEGLDTLASVVVNGTVVFEADNMFRVWRADVSPLLRPVANTLEFTFHSTLPTIAEGQRRRPLREWNIYFDRHNGRGYVRKMACSYGWDWGPVAPTAGIWKPLRLECVRGARWKDVHLRQVHAPGEVTLQILWETEGTGKARFELRRNGQSVATASAHSADGSVRLRVPNPELWWPVDLGAQPLYEFCAILTDPSGAEDRWQCRFGLRSLRLVRERDAAGESFTFEVNGRPIFCKGANWVPHRILLPSITREDLRRLLGAAAECHMNMLRVWGGGIYESDDFYDLCDELGILIWQDFTFACGMYPSWEQPFLDGVAQEARDNVRRLRHHPSLALWCGNNELEGDFGGAPDYSWEEYGRLFDQLLPRVCAQNDPDTPYWPGSPHSPVGPREKSSDDGSGDAHHWSVFFGGLPFEAQREWRCRFMSEYGFQSFPEARTVESYTLPEDRPLTSRIMDYHQRSQAGNRTILGYLLDWFQPGDRLADTFILTQLTQSLCVRYAAEHVRRLQPHCGGVLYWQINDIWPCASWSSIDSFGRWKALQYDAKRFFAPVLVSIEEDLPTSRARIHVSNQGPDAAALEIRWQITDTDGTTHLAGQQTLTLDSQGGQYVADLDATPLLEFRYAHDLMVWAWAVRDGETVSRNWAPLSRPKHLSLSVPGLDVRIEEEGGQAVAVRVRAGRPAYFVMLSLSGEDVRFEDNFFHLHPAEERVIRLVEGPAEAAGFRDKLRVQSLADWCPARPLTEALPAKVASYDLQRKR